MNVTTTIKVKQDPQEPPSYASLKGEEEEKRGRRASLMGEEEEPVYATVSKPQRDASRRSRGVPSKPEEEEEEEEETYSTVSKPWRPAQQANIPSAYAEHNPSCLQANIPSAYAEIERRGLTRDEDEDEDEWKEDEDEDEDEDDDECQYAELEFRGRRADSERKEEAADRTYVTIAELKKG